MKKIVTKVKLKGRDEFEAKLSRAGYDFGAIYWQHDRVYVPRGYQKGRNLPRFVLRTEMKAVDKPAKYYLIFKRHIEDSGVEIENKTEIKDYTEAVEMVMQMGFELLGEVSRKRQETKLKSGEKLYLDNVERISGYFLKVETELSGADVVEKRRIENYKVFEKLEENNFVQGMYAEMLGKNF